MHIMPTLFSRLSILFTVILLCLGLVTWVIAHQSQQQYFEEFTQELNRPVAMYMAQQVPLLVNGRLDSEALADLASHVMMVNPSLELYLLDEKGHVFASALGNAQVQKQIVDLQPIHRFLANKSRMPIYGDNPNLPGQKNVFSAYPLSDSASADPACDPCGYVYAVLGGERTQPVLQSLASSYSLQSSTGMLGGVLLFAMLAGIVLFFTMTRPLRAMTASISQWQLAATSVQAQAQAQAQQNPPAAAAHHVRNELKELEFTCRAMASRLATQYQALDDSDRRRREFLTRISHDLRTPLTILCGAIETVLIEGDNIPSTEAREYLSLAQRQGNRLQQLITQVFELARLDSGEYVLQLEQVSLQELAIDTVQDLQPYAAQHGVRLEACPIKPVKGGSVQADMGLLHRLLDNLLTNAIRHTPKGGLVSLTIKPNKHGMEVEIADSGCGFTDSMNGCTLSSVGVSNHSWWQGSAYESPSAGSQGSGLGLGIVVKILALHGSEARVWSAAGKGTTIRCVLPLADSVDDINPEMTAPQMA